MSFKVSGDYVWPTCMASTSPSTVVPTKDTLHIVSYAVERPVSAVTLTPPCPIGSSPSNAAYC